MSLQSLVFGHVGLVVSCPGEPVAADLADERFDRQVDLGVLAEVGLGCEPGSTLRASVRLGLVQTGVPPVPRLGGGQQRYRSLLRGGVTAGH